MPAMPAPSPRRNSSWCRARTLAQFAGTTGAPANLQNSPVQPERAHRFDIGVSQRLGPNLTLGVDAYYKDVRDLLDYGQFGQALIFTPFNYRQGRIYGVEFSGNWRNERWLFYGNLAHQPLDRARHQLGAIHLRCGGAGLYQPQIRPHRPRPAVHRLGRRGAECLGGRPPLRQHAVRQRPAAGLRQHRENGALCQRQPRPAAGFHRAGRGPLDRAARCAERLRHALPVARWQRHRASARRNTARGAASSPG